MEDRNAHAGSILRVCGHPPALDGNPLSIDARGLLKAETERGVCRVLCFDPRHDVTLATMEVSSIRRVVDLWTQQAEELRDRADIQYVQVFENRGAMMGASNPHPHGQIWATEHVPNEPLAELHAQQAYFAEHGSALLSDYVELELRQRERVVAENETWVTVVPFWAMWPFETLLVPRGRVSCFAGLSEAQRDGLAAMLKTVAAGYNRVFHTPFPFGTSVFKAAKSFSKT
jgi:UDPglucose--hexose-1-phosphate uridylyltransferase